MSTSAPMAQPVKGEPSVPPLTSEVPMIEDTDTSGSLWGFSNAILFIIFIVIVIFGSLSFLVSSNSIQSIKGNWADYRCNPLIMPFAGLFGENTSQNFEFCMGKIFSTHSQGPISSMLMMFGQFTGLLGSVFNSLSSLRVTLASLGGGINVIFQEFTERISNFFFQLRMTSIRIKMLMGRMYAILFSMMYMGTSALTGLSSFTNTYLFSFLDTFCFPGETEIHVMDNIVRRVPIQNVKIGDVLMPGNTRVTATFEFYSTGQPMVRIGPTLVSTNHYLLYKGKPIFAGEHPNAIPYGPWDSEAHLFCLNTEDHIIPIEYLTFLDYDETSEGDADTLRWIEGRLNAVPSVGKTYSYADANSAINEEARIKTAHGLVAAKDIRIGDTLSTGSQVVGLIRREISEYCTLENGTRITPATLYWDIEAAQWKRMGEHHAYQTKRDVFVSFVVVPNSQIELENGLRIRDYMELCSPDAEMYYTEILESRKGP
jgi:hypothetical protein